MTKPLVPFLEWVYYWGEIFTMAINPSNVKEQQ